MEYFEWVGRQSISLLLDLNLFSESSSIKFFALIAQFCWEFQRVENLSEAVA